MSGRWRLRHWRARRDSLPLRVGLAAMACALVGLIGARLYYLLVHAPYLLETALPAARCGIPAAGGWSVFGALLTFVPASFAAAAWLDIPAPSCGTTWRSACSLAVSGSGSGACSTAVASARETKARLGVSLHDTRGVRKPRIPVQFMEMAWWLTGLVAFLLALARRTSARQLRSSLSWRGMASDVSFWSHCANSRTSCSAECVSTRLWRRCLLSSRRCIDLPRLGRRDRAGQVPAVSGSGRLNPQWARHAHGHLFRSMISGNYVRGSGRWSRRESSPSLPAWWNPDPGTRRRACPSSRRSAAPACMWAGPCRTRSWRAERRTTIHGMRAANFAAHRISLVFALYDDGQTSAMSNGSFMWPCSMSGPNIQPSSSGSVGRYCVHNTG